MAAVGGPGVMAAAGGPGGDGPNFCSGGGMIPAAASERPADRGRPLAGGPCDCCRIQAMPMTPVPSLEQDQVIWPVGKIAYDAEDDQGPAVLSIKSRSIRAPPVVLP